MTYEPKQTYRSNLARYGTCTLEDDGCTTCGDVAVPVRVITVESDETALCEDRTGGRATIHTAFTPGADAGDILLVHMGVAISRIEEADSGSAASHSTSHPAST